MRDIVKIPFDIRMVNATIALLNRAFNAFCCVGGAPFRSIPIAAIVQVGLKNRFNHYLARSPALLGPGLSESQAGETFRVVRTLL